LTKAPCSICGCVHTSASSCTHDERASANGDEVHCEKKLHVPGMEPMHVTALASCVAAQMSSTRDACPGMRR